ncbi:intracellular protein transport protein USO1-like isoform X2 [Sparus aurata]|uniref:intracellular protein transport protein USO1-like isoform X2 n=1 Tax=Sparus aurata TaxID=8175 RepID=UPI0011C11A21|nr:intracellular protein transport protein USO1-like isoform X2 [Sparus aurata]
MNRRAGQFSLQALPSLPTGLSLAPPLLPGIERKEKRFGKSITTSGGSVTSEKSQECVMDKPRPGGLLPIPPLDPPQTLKMNPPDNINFGKKEKEKQKEKGIMKGIKGEGQELQEEVKRNLMLEIEQFSEESVVSEYSEVSLKEVEEDIKKDILLQPETTEAFQLMDKVQQQPFAFNGGKYSSAPINEQQEKRPLTHDKLDHMQSFIDNLQSKLEAKKKFASSLQQTVNQLNSDLKAERARNEELQSSLKEAVSQQRKEAADFEYMSQANEELLSEINFLQNELEAGEKQWQLGKKQLQENAEAYSRLEEALEKEKTRYSLACKKIQMQKEESEDLRASFEAMETEYERLKSKCHTFSQSNEEMMSKKNDSRLEEAIKKERAEKELMKAQVADLKNSQKDLQQTEDRLKVTITEMTAEREEHKKVIEKLQWDLKVSSSLPKEVAERDSVNRDEINALKRLVSEQQEKSQQKNDEIESMLFNIQDLKSRIEAKDNVVSSLQGTVHQYASDLRDERTRNCDLQRDYEAAVCQQLKVDQYASDLRDERSRNGDLQRDYEAAVCQQKKQAEELDLLTQKNQQLASDNKGLQDEQQTKDKLKVTISEMTADLEKYESVIEKLQKDLEASSSLHKEAAEHDELHLAEIKALKELISQQQEKSRQKDDEIESMLFDIQNLRSSIKAKDSNFSCLQQTVDQYASDIRDERKRTYDLQRDCEAALCQQQKEAEIRSRLEEAVRKENDHFSRACNKIKLQKKESADLRAQLKTMETAYERMKCEHFLHSESHEEMARQKRTISESQSTITKLVNMLDELKLESETRQGKLLEKLRQERKRNSELQQKVDETSAALIKEKTMCEKHRVELKESLTKQIETLEEKHQFAQALERAQYGFSQFQAQYLAKSNFQFGHISDTDFRLHQQFCSSNTPQ